MKGDILDQQKAFGKNTTEYKLGNMNFTYNDGLEIYHASVNELEENILFIGKEEDIRKDISNSFTSMMNITRG